MIVPSILLPVAALPSFRSVITVYLYTGFWETSLDLPTVCTEFTGIVSSILFPTFMSGLLSPSVVGAVHPSVALYQFNNRMLFCTDVIVL